MKRALSFQLLLLLTTLGCSSDFESEPLGVRWTPPKAFSLARQEPGPPPVAHFSPGLELRRAAVAVPTPSAENVGTILEQVRDAAGVPAGATLVSARAGSIPAGPVGRYELKQGNDRLLVYVLAVGNEALLLTLRAEQSRFGQLQNSVERSLAKLSVR